MWKTFLCLFILISKVLLSDGVALYHEGSKVTFFPDETSEYFGYTVVLTESGLIVGAPKAASRTIKSVNTGLVFSCDFKDLKVKNVTCQPYNTTAGWTGKSLVPVPVSFRDDMWYGATILPMQHQQLLVCAPRWKADWTNGKREDLLALGACFTQTGDRRSKLVPLNEPSRIVFKIDGTRPEHGENGAPIYYYAYGQAGMSAKVVDDSRIIIGAPGLLMWTGGIVEYNYSFLKLSKGVYFSKQPTSNPYFTRQLMPDDYFGYSVESGTFDNSSGILYVAGAPRSQMGFGGVLIFVPPTKETDPIKVKYQIKGPHLGSYFGATLCSADLNGDGRSDLLVGAPTFTVRDGKLHYDQGAVLVYLSHSEGKALVFKQTGLVTGSKRSGARFGSAIADLGDVDGDGFRDIAIGAPFEDDGAGAVYIYRGDANGIKPEALQRVTANARGFGFSISKGYDVDKNNCNDLAVGAFNSGSAYIYRCIPTAKVVASIKLPDVVDLTNTTNFKVLFCINVAKSRLWPKIQVDLKAKITLDNEEGRAMLSGDDEYKVLVAAGAETCQEQIVEVKPTADLSKPISLNFRLEQIQAFNDNSPSFDSTSVRMCEDSVLQTSFQFQLTRDCGEDLVCKPFLVMKLALLDRDPYTPGSGSKLGVKVTILNKEEPAFGAKVYLILPLPIKRLPELCTLKGLNVTCDVPAPLRRNEEVTWDFELEYTQVYGVEESQMKVTARMDDPFYIEDILDSRIQEVVLRILPIASFSVNGKPLPNITVPVSRQKFNQKSIVTVVHYYEIINYGPSDWMPLIAEIRLPKNVTLSNPVQGCEEIFEFVHCVWAAPARVSLPIILTLKVDLHHHGSFLNENNAVNLTTSIVLDQHNKTAKIVSTLVLDPAPPVWPLVVGLAAGFVLLGVIVYGLYKYGFFSRQGRDRLQLLKELEVNELNEPGPSAPDFDLDHDLDHDPGPDPQADESTDELLCDFD